MFQILVPPRQEFNNTESLVSPEAFPSLKGGEGFPGRGWKTGREERRRGESQEAGRPDFGPVFALVCITLHLCFLLPKGPQTPASTVPSQPDTLSISLLASLELLPACQAHELRAAQGRAHLALTKEPRMVLKGSESHQAVKAGIAQRRPRQSGKTTRRS